MSHTCIYRHAYEDEEEYKVCCCVCVTNMHIHVHTDMHTTTRKSARYVVHMLHTCIYMHTQRKGLCACTHMHVDGLVCTHYKHTCIEQYLHTHTKACMNIFMHTYMRTYIHTECVHDAHIRMIHTCIHTYIHTSGPTRCQEGRLGAGACQALRAHDRVNVVSETNKAGCESM